MNSRITVLRTWSIGLLAACFISACQNQGPVPTTTPLPISATQTPRLPPTWTPGTPATYVAPTDTPRPTAQHVSGGSALSPLPPTWTSVPVASSPTPPPIITLTNDPFSLTLTAYVPPTLPPAQPTIPLDLPTQAGTSQPPPLP